MFRFKVPGILPRLFPGFLWHVPVSQPVLYLTFDDGPHPTVTPYVLETLQQIKAKATFFCVGENVQRHPEVYQSILDAGHSSGNHTQNHLDGWKSSKENYLANVEACSLLVKSRLFRPPYGRIKPAQSRLLRKDYKIVMWDILSGDFDPELDREKSLQAMFRYSRPGSILVFHDSLKAEKNLCYLLPAVLEHFHRAGYRFEALPI